MHAVFGLASDQSTAFFVLAGVVVGGVLNGLVTRWLDHGREKIASRAAARLVHAELRLNVQRLGRSLDRAQIDGPGFESEQWIENRALLARTVDEGTWQALLTSYLGLDGESPEHEHDWYSAFEIHREEGTRAATALERYT